MRNLAWKYLVLKAAIGHYIFIEFEKLLGLEKIHFQFWTYYAMYIYYSIDMQQAYF